MCVELELSSSSTFRDMSGVPKCPVPPHAPSEKIFILKEYFALSKCLQNFDFLALVASEI